MDCKPEHLRYSSTPLKDTSEPYSSAISLKLLCHEQTSAIKMKAPEATIWNS